MHKLPVTALIVVCMALAPGAPAPAPAATGVEYGGVVSQNQGGGSTSPKFGSVKKGRSSPKKSKSKR